MSAAVDFFLSEFDLTEIMTPRGYARRWSEVWSVYSVFDPSYANRESFGFFVDVGNGWTTMVRCSVKVLIYLLKGTPVEGHPTPVLLSSLTHERTSPNPPPNPPFSHLVFLTRLSTAPHPPHTRLLPVSPTRISHVSHPCLPPVSPTRLSLASYRACCFWRR